MNDYDLNLARANAKEFREAAQRTRVRRQPGRKTTARSRHRFLRPTTE